MEFWALEVLKVLKDDTGRDGEIVELKTSEEVGEGKVLMDWMDADGEEVLVMLRLDFETLAEEDCGT